VIDCRSGPEEDVINELDLPQIFRTKSEAVLGEVAADGGEIFVVVRLISLEPVEGQKQAIRAYGRRNLVRTLDGEQTRHEIRTRRGHLEQSFIHEMFDRILSADVEHKGHS